MDTARLSQFDSSLHVRASLVAIFFLAAFGHFIHARILASEKLGDQ